MNVGSKLVLLTLAIQAIAGCGRNIVQSSVPITPNFCSRLVCLSVISRSLSPDSITLDSHGWKERMNAIAGNEGLVEIKIERKLLPCKMQHFVAANTSPHLATWVGCLKGDVTGESIQFVVSYRHDGVDPELLSPPADAVWLRATDPSNEESIGYVLRIGPAVYLKRR